jgi:hypothetical protein
MSCSSSGPPADEAFTAELCLKVAEFPRIGNIGS